MRAVDTNVLVRLLVRDDADQVAAAEAFVGCEAWVSHLVLLEALWVLDAVHRLTADQQTTVVAMLLEHQHLSLQEPEVVRAALDRFRSRPALGFSDCLVLETARKAGQLPLGTFDRKLARSDGATLVRRA